MCPGSMLSHSQGQMKAITAQQENQAPQAILSATMTPSNVGECPVFLLSGR
jgi:hypothetical protein